MKHVPLKEFFADKKYEFTEKEISFFRKSIEFKDIENWYPLGMYLYALAKRNNLKRVLVVDTRDWFFCLSFARGGAWVVTLSDYATSPKNFGILNAYKDKIFQVIQSPADYLRERKSTWDIIYTRYGSYDFYKDYFSKYLICNGEVYTHEKT